MCHTIGDRGLDMECHDLTSDMSNSLDRKVRSECAAIISHAMCRACAFGGSQSTSKKATKQSMVGIRWFQNIKQDAMMFALDLRT